MDIDWDDGKAAKNLGKHKVAFESVRAFEFDTAVINRFEYEGGEERIVQFGFIGSKLHVLVYTDRGDSHLDNLASPRREARMEMVS